MTNIILKQYFSYEQTKYKFLIIYRILEIALILSIKCFIEIKIYRCLQCLRGLHGNQFEIDFDVLRVVCLDNRCTLPKIHYTKQLKLIQFLISFFEIYFSKKFFMS